MQENGLWRLWQDRSVHVARRSLAGLVWRYEQAPMRTLLIGPEGLYLLDGLLLASVRAMLRVSDRIHTAAPRSPVAPYSSGWTGNLIFLASWTFGIVAVASAYRAYR